jgi:hypothetical protein
MRRLVPFLRLEVEGEVQRILLLGPALQRVAALAQQQALVAYPKR